MANHNRWLDWKIRHGLATRGRVGDGPYHPKGLFAGILYKLYFRKRDPGLKQGPQTYGQSVGGTLGPTGSTNGDE